MPTWTEFMKSRSPSMTATDSMTSKTISVTITDANEAPIVTSDGGGTTAAINVAENTTAGDDRHGD